MALTDEEVRVRIEDAIGEQLTKPLLRPALNDEARDEMEVGARVDVVSDACGDDREDGGGALAAEVEPREEPIFATEDQPSKLALATIVGQLDVSVVEEEGEALPLPMEVSEGAAERCLGRNESSLLVEELTDFEKDRVTLLASSSASLVGGVTGTGRCALDREEAGDLAEGFERDRVSRARVRRIASVHGSSIQVVCRQRAR